MKIILASSSPRRKDILKDKGYDFDVIYKDVDETFNPNLDVYENVKALGLKKCMSVSTDYPNDIVIGCDTIVVYDNVVYHKPINEDDAFNTLKILSDNTHEVISGVGIIYKDKIYNFNVITKVTFKKLSDNDILDYIKTKESFGKSGSYAIQGLGSKLVSHYEGSITNVIGLPIDEVSKIIDELRMNPCHLK